jgi:GntR family transcriptional repressor for pyruvate dehydrogenase complex
VTFAQIDQLRAHEYVAEQMRRHIGLRLVDPGEPLPPERELARMFGVGRATVQQAIKLLEADGLVASRRGRLGGTFVTGVSQDEAAKDQLLVKLRRNRGQIEEAIECRRALEPRVAGIAAAKRRSGDLRALRRTRKLLEAAERDQDDAAYMRHDSEFHLGIARATRNSLFIDTLERVRLLYNDALTALPGTQIWHNRLSLEHKAIFDAIEAQDTTAAEAAMLLHVHNAEGALRALLEALRR